MSTRNTVVLLALFGAPAALAGQGAAGGSGPATAEARPMMRAHARGSAITVDGRLVEADWQAAMPATDFKQFDPKEGEPSTQRTEIRILFDSDALYIGARMFDELGARGVRTRLARRDQINEGDNIQFVLDTFHDHTGRTIFTINPSGSRGDAGQASPFADPAWEPVWEVATQIDSLGWSAEARIPLSQLRFPAGSNQTWGMQVWRYVERLNETSMWSFWGRQQQGGPMLFGHIEGLELESHKLGVEVLPYVVTRAEAIRPAQPGTPLRDPREYALRAGGDVKALLTSTITLDATINPDFGQVEVDPAVVNLSAFETFFEEKRPFFIEGSGLFGFGGFNCYFCSNVQSMSLFYSRRIGRRPQGFVTDPAKFTEIPENSTILGAAKVTGRTHGGMQIGLMNALTSSERADAISMSDTPFDQEVEPLTNYFVGRVKKNYRGGNLTLGAIGTSVIRSFENDGLRDLVPGHAEAVGGDWNVWWKQQTYNLMGNIALTQVSGDANAIARLQRSSARYFARPDREHGSNGFLTDRYDPQLTEMRGAGGYARLAKNAGTWLWETAVNVRTPGFEANDLAFLTRADYVWMNGNILRQWTRPTKHFRQTNVTLGAQQQYNFDGDMNDRQLHAGWWMQLHNLWTINSFAIRRPEVFDERLTRGGAVVKRAGSWFGQVNLGTDSRKKVVLNGNTFYQSNDDDAWSLGGGVSARFKPATNLSVSFGPSFSRTGTRAQFVRTFSDPSATDFYGQRAVFADLVQHSLALDTRMSATFTPTLTLELYAQPFVSSGEYDAFKEFAAPRELEKRVFDATQLRSTVRTSDGRTVYTLDPDRNVSTANFSFDNPDFNFRSLRGNAVLRWEYRPGSTLFLVWQQQRSGSEMVGDFDVSRDAGAIFRGRPDNIFLLKATYWVGK